MRNLAERSGSDLVDLLATFALGVSWYTASRSGSFEDGLLLNAGQ
jgi:hypothetical protein